MIRETKNGVVGPGKPTGLTAAIEKLADAMAEGRAWMGPRKAAEFLDMDYPEFKKIAPRLPRHPIPREEGPGPARRYRYYAPELTDWLLSQRT